MWLTDEISNRATHNTSSRAAKELTRQQCLIPTDAHEQSDPTIKPVHVNHSRIAQCRSRFT